MVLHHVAQGAGLVVVGGALLDAHGLGDGDLDMVDVGAVPDRLEQRVGEAQGQEVLDRFLPEIMVDPVDLRFVEHPADLVVDADRRGEVAADRLFQHDPRLGRDDPGGTGTFADRAEQVGRGGEVEQARPVLAAGQRLRPRPAQLLAGGDVERHVGDALREPREHRLVEAVADMLAAGRLDLGDIVGGGELAARDADDPAALGHLLVAFAPVERRHELAEAEVARGAEHHEIEDGDGNDLGGHRPSRNVSTAARVGNAGIAPRSSGGQRAHGVGEAADPVEPRRLAPRRRARPGYRRSARP